MTTYTFTQPSGVRPGQLANEIRQDPGISMGLEYINYLDPDSEELVLDGRIVNVAMSGALEGAELSVLGNIVSGHLAHPTDSSLQYWDQAHDLNRDYKFKRTKIAQIVASKGWDNLSYQEKEIASRWFVVEAAKRSQIHTMDEQVGLGVTFHKCSVEARVARYEAASSEVYNRLSRPEQISLVGDVEKYGLPHLYTEYGIEGTLEGDVEGLFDYLEGREDTKWAGSGLLQKDFTPSGVTMEHLVDKVMSVLVSGLYDYRQFA